MAVTYTDQGTEYPELKQPQGDYVRQAEEERDGEEVTWPEIEGRAWELQIVQEEQIELRHGWTTVEDLREMLAELPDEWVFARNFFPTRDPNRACDLLFTPVGDADRW